MQWSVTWHLNLACHYKSYDQGKTKCIKSYHIKKSDWMIHFQYFMGFPTKQNLSQQNKTYSVYYIIINIVYKHSRLYNFLYAAS